MQVKQIVPCLDVRNGKVVKGQQFVNIKEVDDPVALAEYYNASGADEIVLYDISASLEERNIFSELVSAVKAKVSVPLMVGGGINSIEDCTRLIGLGANSLSINTGAIKKPTFIKEVSDTFGTEKTVLSVDVKKENGEYYIFAKGGQENTGILALEHIKKGETDGAGKVVVNSISADGEKTGFDLELLEQVANTVSIPIVASGGAGKKEDFLELFTKLPTIAVGLGASVFHFKEINIAELKEYLAKNGIPVAKKEILNG